MLLLSEEEVGLFAEKASSCKTESDLDDLGFGKRQRLSESAFSRFYEDEDTERYWVTSKIIDDETLCSVIYIDMSNTHIDVEMVYFEEK